ncbi:MAG: hypothetical protein AAGA77_03420 [Bacteroidota bacterium]
MPDNLIVEHIYLSVFDDENKKDEEKLMTEVIVTMKNQAKYLATFYTYEYLQKKIRNSEKKKKLYWCMEQFTLVESLELSGIEEVVDKMIDCGDFQLMFLKLD